VSESEIARWYPQSYYGETNGRFHALLEVLVRGFRRRRASVIARLVRQGPVLDVGCGSGVLLDALRAKGYVTRGVELSDHAARQARDALGLDVDVGSLDAASFRAESFRAVIFWHSLEHFRDPLAALACARSLLVPGGYLVIAVPNSDSVQARLFGGAWFHLDVPRHYVHFGLASLLRALEQHRFLPHIVSHFSLEQNPYGILQSLYNAIGFQFNLLYSLMKRPGERSGSAPAAQVALVLLLLPVVAPIALLFWVVELAARRGGTVEVYAQKI
jgi:SAM-dependent methyltransferase